MTWKNVQLGIHLLTINFAFATSSAVIIMDVLSSDIILNLILPLLPLYVLIALQHTSKRYHRLVRSAFTNKPRSHIKILGDICEGGHVNLLRWFLGRGKSDLGWSLLITGVENLLLRGKLQNVY